MRASWSITLLAASALAGTVLAGQATRPAGPIHGVRVLSDQVDDLSSIEAIGAHLARLSSDAERAHEIFRLSNKYRHQCNPPHEFLGSDDHVHEPIKIFNVYGYCKCCCAAALLMALGREAGLPARGWSLTHHSVSEVYFDRGWHMFDLSLMNYFITDDGQIAGAEDLIAQKGRLINREHSPFIDEKGVYQSMFRTLPPGELSDYEVEGSHIYEYTYTVGHRIGLSLRQGETVELNWGNKGRHINERQLDFWQAPLDDTGPAGSQRYLETYYPGYSMGLVGNGLMTYSLDLATSPPRGLLSHQNMTVRRDAAGAPMLAAASPGAGEIVVPFTSSYVFLGGSVSGRFLRADEGSAIRLSISLNHGLDWQPVWTAEEVGVFDATIDLEPYLFRRYQYLARLEIEPSAVGAAGVLALDFRHEIQHAQRALPLLRRGSNRITIVAPEPALATRTIEAALLESSPLNATYRDFHPEVLGVGHRYQPRKVGATSCYLFLEKKAERGSVTFPLDTPGPIRQVRFGGSFRSRGPGAGIRLLVSDSEGRSWKTAGTLGSGVDGLAKYVKFSDLEPETRRVLVRYEFLGPGEVGMFVFRIDADYLDPSAGERPVEVTYEWSERETPRRHTQVVTRYPFSYTIEAGGEPLMKSLTVRGR